MKPDTDHELHVSLRFPMRIKLLDVSTPFIAFDGTLDEVRGNVGVFKTDRIYLVGGLRDAKIPSLMLDVPESNIAGVVRQPFKEK